MNEVVINGHLSVQPIERELPSGDVLVSFRVVVPRSGAVLKRSRQRFDVIECAAWTARLQKQVLTLLPGDNVQVSGALRRRFSSSGTSWCAVDVTGLHRTQ